MSIYVDRDIETTFEGDLVIDQKGDLKLANSLDTYKAVANFILRSDYGDYAPDSNVGSNLGSFIGQNNVQSVHKAMEYSIARSIAGPVFTTSDVRIKVLPLDIYEAVCFVFLAGTFLIDEELVKVEQDRIAYSFPYMEGAITPLTI